MTWVHVEGIGDDAGGELILEGRQAHYLGRVLRSRVGDPVTAFDGNGKTASARVHSFSPRSATLEVLEVTSHARPRGRITAQIALLKGERLDYSLQKLTELGVDAIELLSTERTVVRWTAKRAGARLERCREITISAAAQSQRPWLPQVAGPVAVASTAIPTKALGLAMLVDRAGAQSLERRISDWSPETQVAFAIGPEGGFTEAEAAALEDKGYQATSLGAQILRAETAALAAAVLVGFGLGRYRAHPG